MNMIMSKIIFGIINICFPLLLGIIYSRNSEKQQRNYDITKGVWYLIYGGVVAVDYLYQQKTQYIAGFPITLAIMEGVPLIMKRVFNSDAD